MLSTVLRRFALLALLAGGCTNPVTAIQVVVSSDLSVPAELDEIVIVAVHPDTGREQLAIAALGPGEPALPRSLTMAHQGGPLGPYLVTVTARQAGTVAVERRGELTFVRGELRTWRISLNADCRGVDCGAETCSEGTCRAIAVSESELDVWIPSNDRDSGGPVVDAGDAVDAGADAGAIDAGNDGGSPLSDAGIDGGPGSDAGPAGCTCPGSCGSSCSLACNEAGASCTVGAASSDSVTGTCEGGATCTVDATGITTLDLTCRGTGTRCSIDCTSARSCTVRCLDGASCAVRCNGSPSCQILDCPVALTSCPGGGQACASACWGS